MLREANHILPLSSLRRSRLTVGGPEDHKLSTRLCSNNSRAREGGREREGKETEGGASGTEMFPPAAPVMLSPFVGAVSSWDAEIGPKTERHDGPISQYASLCQQTKSPTSRDHNEELFRNSRTLSRILKLSTVFRIKKTNEGRRMKIFAFFGEYFHLALPPG